MSSLKAQSDRPSDTPKALHTKAQGRPPRAHPGEETPHVNVYPEGVIQHAAQISRVNSTPHRVEPFQGTVLVGRPVAQGSRLARQPWAMVCNAFSVVYLAMRFAIITAILLATASRSFAQVTKIGEEGDEVPPTYKMTVSPAAEPQPALKYHFLVPPVDQIKGNAATFYYKGMVFDGPDLWRWEPELSDKIYKWLDTPTDQLPQNEIASKILHFKSQTPWQAFSLATRCDHCDWGDQIREDGIFTLLEQAQKLRRVAVGIALRARTEMAGGKHTEAIDSLRTGYTLSRNLSHAPTIIQNLIGIAIQQILDDQTRTFIAAENSPNLYWALSDLAARPIDMRYAFSYESRLWQFTVHELDELTRRTFSNEEAVALAQKLSQVTDSWRSRGRQLDLANVLVQLRTFAWVLQLYPQAKAYLLEQGYAADNLSAMPVTQVVLLYRWKQFEIIRDNVFKWLMLPADEAKHYQQRANDDLKAAMLRGEGEPFADLISAVQAALTAQLRALRQVNVLRTIEALRMHAAQHGEWPEKLDDITAAPVPLDPFTDKPFEYSLNDGVATLRIEKSLRGGWKGEATYELTLRKPKETPDK